MSTFGRMNTRNQLVIVALPLIAGLWLAPSALADPPNQQRDVTAVDENGDTTTFSVTYHNPPNAEGIASSFTVVPNDETTGPATDAGRFVYHEVLITNPNGVVHHYGDAENSVGRNHPLVTISYQGVEHPEDTINRTGFYVPARPPK